MDVDRSFIEMLHIAQRMSEGELPAFEGETFTVGAFDMILTRLKNGEAFQLLERACAEYPTLKHELKMRCAFIDLVADLAHASNTTELPKGMEEIVRENPGESTRLMEWYRIR